MKPPGRRRASARVIVLSGLLVLAGAGIAGFFMLGEILSAPAGQPAAADLIVVLGGDDGSRAIRATALFREQRNCRILLTGIEGGPAVTRNAYLNWRAQFLVDDGIPADRVLFDLESGNSWQEARNTLQLMKASAWSRVIVISDPPHMRRLQWVWGKVFAGSGVEFVLVASTPAWWDPSRWWASEKSAQFVLMELIKLAYYRVVY